MTFSDEGNPRAMRSYTIQLHESDMQDVRALLTYYRQKEGRHIAIGNILKILIKEEAQRIRQ